MNSYKLETTYSCFQFSWKVEKVLRLYKQLWANSRLKTDCKIWCIFFPWPVEMQLNVLIHWTVFLSLGWRAFGFSSLLFFYLNVVCSQSFMSCSIIFYHSLHVSQTVSLSLLNNLVCGNDSLLGAEEISFQGNLIHPWHYIPSPLPSSILMDDLLELCN